MATGWAGDGAVQDQIDATVKDAVDRAKNRLPSGPRAGDIAVRRTPAGSRLPSCSRGFRPPRREAVVAGAATSELGS